ncbi:MAG TPA: periplasmic heavy metal sensor [Thermoanaerobaculia bacterium]|nr:periplasmic heavy metal sensor [Thermoanaerobaculia bacterium]
MKRLLFALLALSISAAALAADLPPGKWWRKPEVVQNLGVTEDQQNRLETIWRAASTDLIDFRGEVEKQNIALRTELDRPQLDRRAVQAAATRLNAARGRLFERELMMLVDMRGVLSDSQWTRMRAFLDRVEANRPLQQQRRRQQ